jgi:methylated-DNA-protein-cysteine methyltransferase related protein
MCRRTFYLRTSLAGRRHGKQLSCWLVCQGKQVSPEGDTANKSRRTGDTAYMLMREKARPTPGADFAATTLPRLIAVIRQIPAGRVASYGQVAQMAGFARGARLTVRALRGAEGLAWWRVVRSDGGLAVAGQGDKLRAEGIECSDVKIDMARYRWCGAEQTLDSFSWSVTPRRDSEARRSSSKSAIPASGYSGRRVESGSPNVDSRATLDRLLFGELS